MFVKLVHNIVTLADRFRAILASPGTSIETPVQTLSRRGLALLLALTALLAGSFPGAHPNTAAGVSRVLTTLATELWHTPPGEIV